MNKAYRLLLALCATAATLSSCSRANYAFNPATPAYLGSQPARTEAVRSAPAVAVAPTVVEAAPVAAEPIRVEAPVAVASTTPAVTARPAKVAAQPVATEAPAVAVAEAPAKAAKPSLVQRLMLKKVSKQLAKLDARKQNAAGATHTEAKGAGLTVAIIGLIALLVGIIASSGLVITLGAIVLVVGLVLLLLGSL